ncbi:hypothetical protein [Thalassotalea sp. ND16A]|uniref:hypothetical protein n=1 Tax=Thalassotalea sp. ND16A TaxID=1535422 RepID=UPI00051D7CC1|nr:hypothetical protein [Thalassotalea sp. ND16A]KGJ93365.1 hypothetical protein ND16A_1523 [Thalassotalea sp. ND16A]
MYGEGKISANKTVAEFSELRAKIGWAETEFAMAKNSLANSLFHVVIRDQFKLIGMGRVIGDGSMYFYVQDVVVDPHYHFSLIAFVFRS